MDELLVALDELAAELDLYWTARGELRSGRVLAEVWPDELESLCEHVWLLRLLVRVCEAHQLEEEYDA